MWLPTFFRRSKSRSVALSPRGKRRRPLCEALESRALLTINPNAIPTVGVYDENVIQPNTVDFVASGSAVTNVQFSADVAAAYAQDSGGVINGEVLGAYHSYGVDHQKVLEILPGDGTNWGIGAPFNPIPISGTGAFATFSPTYNYLDLNFVNIDGGSANEHVVEFGLTALSTSYKDFGNVTVAGQLAGGGEVSAVRHINDMAGQGDTFYGLKAPTGDYFTGLTIRYDGSVTSNYNMFFDDVGFITADVTANHPPVAADDAYSVDENGSLGTAAPGVLANDLDADGNSLSAALVSGPAHGSLAFNADGSFSYTPDAYYYGADSFTYKANDGQADSNVATVSLTVNKVAYPPSLGDATFSIPENTANGTIVGAMQGTELNGEPLSYAIAGGNSSGAFAIDPSTGAISVADSTQLDYEKVHQFSLTIQATNLDGLSAQATATINLTDVIETISASIDVEPSSSSNVIELNGHHKVQVAILSSATFNALDVNVNSLTFGETGNEDSLVRDHRGRPRYKIADVNGDGLLDLVVWFDVADTGLKAGDTQAVLHGTLASGDLLVATDSVTIASHGRRR